jgi:GNAT superfamily N-acetyltransferase
MMTGVSWRIRPFAAAADRAWVRLLWQAAMPPSWPVLPPAGIGQFGEGLAAQTGHVRVGFAALETAGSIPLILVEPGYQRRGIGTGLPEAALQQVRAGTASSVTAGSGGAAYIWPGVPRDLPAAVRFFASRGGGTPMTPSTW